MENEWEQPNLVIRTRTPRVNGVNGNEGALRASLLSDSTSGIVKGEDGDTTSDATTTFSSPEMDFSAKDRFNTISKNHTKSYNNINDEKEDEEIKVLLNVDQKMNDLKETEDENVNKVPIPDGGWGWVVVMSSFVISMIADGISFSFGLLYIEFLDEFEASKSTTAWIGSLFIAVPLLSGPVMSALVDRYGCRSMTILGGLISTLGFVLASISTTLEMMMITFGVIAGLGLGLVYVTAVVSIAYWFEKKRNLAVGLGACGTGVGTFLYAPMTQYFIEEFGWRGTILLLSGTLLNLCVCGCVMRDPEWWIMEQKKQNSKNDGTLIKDDDKSKSSSFASISNPYVLDFDVPTRGKVMDGLIKRGVSPQKVISQEAASIRRHQNLILIKKKISSKKRSQSLVNLPTYLTYSEQVRLFDFMKIIHLVSFDYVTHIRKFVLLHFLNFQVSLTMLDSLIKATSKDYGIEIKYPRFAVMGFNRPKKCTIDVKENDDPPVVTYPKTLLHRTHSEKYEESNDKLPGEYQVKSAKQNFVFRKSKSESREDKELVKQDSKENKRDWLKKQLSVNHHYLKDLKMPLNSISHRNAMLNIKGYRLKASSCPDIFKNSMITIADKEEVSNTFKIIHYCLILVYN
jgi:MFS transporter, MCT family, solute carrier family 16 (monocarboxylic acid transporters), member 14